MSTQAAAVCGESRRHGDSGGDEETGREVPHLVPTHCGRGGTALALDPGVQALLGGGFAPAAYCERSAAKVAL